MANMQFDLVSPERRLASMEVSEVMLPAAEGDLTAMVDHAPMITTLRPGLLKVTGPEGEKAFLVTGGFADIAGPSTTVLAERAMAVEDVTGDVVEELISAAQAKVEAASDATRDAANAYHAQLTAALDVIVAR